MFAQNLDSNSISPFGSSMHLSTATEHLRAAPSAGHGCSSQRSARNVHRNIKKMTFKCNALFNSENLWKQLQQNVIRSINRRNSFNGEKSEKRIFRMSLPIEDGPSISTSTQVCHISLNLMFLFCFKIFLH